MLPSFHLSQTDPSLSDFDQTLGYPGEGPVPFFFCLCWALFGFSRLEPGGCSLSWIFAAICSSAMAAPLHPRNAGNLSRAKIREGRGPLPTGRPVLKVTEKHREQLLESFRAWLATRGVSAAELFADTYHNVEEINVLLSSYGRALYKAGRPLAHYSETVNAISSWKPQLRRVLQGAWDLAYSWVKTEPSTHHTAMPPQVLMGMLTCCLTWGWIRLAGCLALAYKVSSRLESSYLQEDKTFSCLRTWGSRRVPAPLHTGAQDSLHHGQAPVGQGRHP